VVANALAYGTAQTISLMQQGASGIEGYLSLRERLWDPLAATESDPGCVKTPSRLCVSAQFAETIDEAVH